MTIQGHSRPKPNSVDLQTDYINILEQIGKASAANIKIKLLIEQLEKTTINRIEKSFNNWTLHLPVKLTKTSKEWSSTHSYWTSRDKLVSSYCYQFRKDLSDSLRQWTEEELERIAKSYSANIYSHIRIEFDKLDDLKMSSSRKSIFILHSCREKARYNHQKSISDYYTLSYAGDEFTKKIGFFESSKIKVQVIDIGCTHIKKTELPKVRKDIIDRINSEVFTGVRKCTDDGFSCAISQYENILESLGR